MELFASLWGGEVRKRPVRKSHHKQAWEVSLGPTSGLRDFLEDIIPFLREKEPQALLLLEALDLSRGDPRKADIKEELKELKHGY